MVQSSLHGLPSLFHHYTHGMYFIVRPPWMFLFRIPQLVKNHFDDSIIIYCYFPVFWFKSSFHGLTGESRIFFFPLNSLLLAIFSFLVGLRRPARLPTLISLLCCVRYLLIVFNDTDHGHVHVFSVSPFTFWCHYCEHLVRMPVNLNDTVA